MKITVSQLIVRYVERLGIECIFGMPGAHILPVYDNLYDSNIEAVLAKHEQGAAFMAGGYARASGKIGACITTAGPGATNLVTGIANAYADKQPILIITGETSTHIFGKGGLQESSGEGGTIDQLALFKSITRYNKVVERTDYLAQVLNQASRILFSSTPGPVLLSFPFNVQKESVDEALLDEVITHKPILSNKHVTTDALSKALLEAKKPIIIAGYGCFQADAQQELAQLSEQLNIPVTTSLKAKGVIDEHSPLSLGSLGVSSSGYAYEYIATHADLLIILGAAFNERTSYLWDKNLTQNKKIIQIDNNPEQLDKVFRADIAVQGDIKDVLSQLLEEIKSQQPVSNDTQSEIQQIKHSANPDYAVFQSGFALVEYFYSRLEKAFPDDAVIFDDNIIFAQNFFSVSSNSRYYPNSGISSLGHAIPAAIGAQFNHNHPTFAILGDGGFQMCCMEIMTAVNYDKPLNIVMFNNSSMGLIRKNQHQQYEQRYINCDFTNPDYEQLAKSFNINYKQINTATDIDDLFTRFDLKNHINLIDIIIDKNTFPNYSSRR